MLKGALGTNKLLYELGLQKHTGNAVESLFDQTLTILPKVSFYRLADSVKTPHSPRARLVRFSVIATLTCCLWGCSNVQSPVRDVDANMLLGTWKVDLRPTPDAQGYFQEFIVTSVDGKSFEGAFYGTPVTQGRINNDWGKLRIAFVTSDGSGPYNHSAVLEGERLEGLSNSTGRDFLSYWSAEKQ